MDNPYDRINDYGSVSIRLASPEDIRSWSYGEVKKPETINYRTYRIERDGLFCERIFGPEKDWECFCGKYKGIKYKGIVCDRCGVEITLSRVRRKSMGHINLAAPVAHIWFFKTIPSRIGTLLGMKATALERVIYYQDYVVTQIKNKKCPLKEKQLLTEEQYKEYKDRFGDDFEADMGAGAIKHLLITLDLQKTSNDPRRGQEERRHPEGKDAIGVARSMRATRPRTPSDDPDVIPDPPDCARWCCSTRATSRPAT